MLNSLKRRTIRNRLYLLLLLFSSAAFGVYIILHSLEDSIVFFYTPSKLQTTSSREQKNNIRLGGIVLEGSIIENNGETIFTLTDYSATIKVKFSGILPALFREGQGIVAEGRLQNDLFYATRLLAKHDNNYKPPEIRRNIAEKTLQQ